MIIDEFMAWMEAEGVEAKFLIHAGKVSEPIKRESIYWQDLLLDFSDAHAWANDLRAIADEWENRAMAEATETLTVAQAKGFCHTEIRWASALKRLAESADRRTSVLQTLLKQR